MRGPGSTWQLRRLSEFRNSVSFIREAMHPTRATPKHGNLVSRKKPFGNPATRFPDSPLLVTKSYW
jgi:hypothetical protein